ncbi:MAG TPA: tetratricopeptide repeat protein [Xanthobacteraceae bacterium]|nr:tetratricopeptide repeat protein [Xanthobacteraceae bacterium]
MMRPLRVDRSRTSVVRLRALLVTSALACAAVPLQIGDARAQAGGAATAPQADAKAAAAKAEADIHAARLVAAARPADEAPVRILVDLLARAGRTREAVAEADRFAAGGNASAALRAQRGFLRRKLGDLAGAIDDFNAALQGGTLAPDQRRNVEAGLGEARVAQMQRELARAQDDLAAKDFARAAEEARRLLADHPGTEAAMRIRIAALIGAGDKRAALAELDQIVQAGEIDPLLLAQRGYLRRELGDARGAAQDFTAALHDLNLAPDQRRNLEAALAEARATEAQAVAISANAALTSVNAALARRDYAAALAASEAAVRRDPASEPAMLARLDALIGAGQKRQALAESDAFISRQASGHAASALMRARRGFLRRELGNTGGAIEDFAAALAGEGLNADQRKNVTAALAEARAAGVQDEYNRAQAALAKGDFAGAARIADGILARDPNAEAAMRLRLDALTRAGRKDAARADMDRLIARGNAPAWLVAQRGYARYAANELAGAVHDFDAALRRRDLDRKSVADIRYTRTVAVATLAERAGKPREVEAAYRDYLKRDPNRADAWFKLGYLLLKEKRREEAAEALSRGLALRPDGPAYLDATNASILTDAPRASAFYRKALDLWYAGDKSLADKTATDMARVRNEVDEADASIRTSIGLLGITARPQTAGGNNLAAGADTRVRFDGRYLPDIPGLEAFVRGLTGKDANGIRETESGVGLRYRPFSDINFYVGGLADHFFQPNVENEMLVIWGLGVGADSYPYRSGWMPYWDFGTFGTWRTGDTRVLQDIRANGGFLYQLQTPLRTAIGPTLLAVGGYDNQATNPFAAGIGPSVLANFWVGGDRYRSYDALVSVQVGYVFNVGIDERQRGWRATIGVTF